MKSKTVQRLLDEMENEPWHVKIKRWYRLKVWTYKCMTRKYWDTTFEGYIFKNSDTIKKNKNNNPESRDDSKDDYDNIY